MARYLYDVNRTTRFFDVHKQFQGGLKTVDTDDALGAVFLREAQNVSLSEFGFIEKRYGTYLNNKAQLTGTLQGYFEFKGYKIYVVDNTFYVDGNPVTEILKEKENEWRYPTLPVYPFVTETKRDMNAVNIKEVLYIFTGVYPVYVKEVEGQLKFYWFSVDIPSYDEIVVTGHNLLEDDYENLYFSETPKLPSQTTSFDPGLEYPKIKASAVTPTLANKNDPLKFHFNTQYPNDMNAWNPASDNSYFEINLESVSFRTTGAGASDLDFIAADIEDIAFEKKSNYYVQDPDEDDSVASRGDVFLSQQPFTEVGLKTTITTGEENAFSGRRSEYRIKLNFEITKDDFFKNNRYIIEAYRYKGDDGFVDFILEDAHNFNNFVEYPKSTKLKITPIDYNGNELKKQSYTIDLIGKSTYDFDTPTSGVLNRDSTIEKYKFELDTKAWESYEVNNAVGPSDLESNPENYYFDVVAISEKEPATLGNGITSSSVPSLNFELKNLISGRYDFKVKFVREEWRRVTQNGQFNYLELVQREFFETTVLDVIITEEQLQDFPRKDEDSIGIEYPKLKPIWTCNKVIEHFGKLMVWGSKEMPTAVFYSFPDRPTYFPSKFYLDFQNDEGSALQNITPYMNILVAQTEDRTWGVRGNSGLIDAPSPYVSFTINPTVGTIAYKSVRPVRNHLFFLSKQGIVALKSLYAADEQYNIDFVDRNIRNIVPQDKNAVGIQYDNQYWLNFPNFGITLRWYIDKKAWVKDVFAWEDFKGVFKWQNVDGKLEFITYPNALQEDTNDYVYKIGVDESLPADMGSNILTKFETSFLNQNYPFHQKNYKEFKYDFTMQNEYNFSRDPVYDKTFDLTDEVTVLNLQEADFKEPLLRNHTYMLSFSDVVEVDTLTISKTNEETNTVENTLIENLVKFDGSYYLDGNTDYFFVMPNSLNGKFDVDIQLTTPLQGINERVSLRDTTYDETMVFLSKVITEERNVINQQLPIGYTEQQEAIEINLADFQDFTLGTTFFGDRITFIKTIKLSGKGYNTKAYFEDVSKAKWTIESMGITYKMKRARGD